MASRISLHCVSLFIGHRCSVLGLGEPKNERRHGAKLEDIHIYILFQILNISSLVSSSSTCINTQPPFLTAPDVFCSLTLLVQETLSIPGLFALPLILDPLYFRLLFFSSRVTIHS